MPRCMLRQPPVCPVTLTRIREETRRHRRLPVGGRSRCRLAHPRMERAAPVCGGVRGSCV